MKYKNTRQKLQIIMTILVVFVAMFSLTMQVSALDEEVSSAIEASSTAEFEDEESITDEISNTDENSELPEESSEEISKPEEESSLADSESSSESSSIEPGSIEEDLAEDSGPQTFLVDTIDYDSLPPVLPEGTLLPDAASESVELDERARSGTNTEKYNYGALQMLRQGRVRDQFSELVNFYNKNAYSRQTMTDIKNLTLQITKGVGSQDQKAMIIHDWVARNIVYDMDAFYSPREVDYLMASDALFTFRDRRGMCAGYSQLTLMMMKYAGLNATFIGGYAGGPGTTENKVLNDSNHAWNAVLIDGSWKFVDTTWDSPGTYKNGIRYPSNGIYRNYYKPSLSVFSRDHKSFFFGFTPQDKFNPQEMPNPTPVAQFVTRLYKETLGRNPDASGLKNWTDLLLSGEVSGAEAVEGFVLSPEFMGKKLSNSNFVEVLYRVLLNRGSDPPGKNSWVKFLEQSCSRKLVTAEFARSVEFKNICNSYGISAGAINLPKNAEYRSGITMFVHRLYVKALGRNPDPSGLNNWASIIANGQKPKQVAHGFIFSPEFKNKNLSNRDFVIIMYRTFLDREADPAGLNNWVNLLNQGKSREDIFNGFADSQEFQRIVKSFGI